MQFTLDNEVFDTAEMVCIEVDGIYFNIYLMPQRGLVFLQTFEEEHGVMIRKATGGQTAALLAAYSPTKMPDISSYQDVIDRLFVVKSSAFWRGWFARNLCA